jgi:hypothetical protein
MAVKTRISAAAADASRELARVSGDQVRATRQACACDRLAVEKRGSKRGFVNRADDALELIGNLG